MNAGLRTKLLEHSKEAHFYQLSERDRIGSQIGFCLAGLGLVGNACVFYIYELPTSLTTFGVVYWILTAGGLLAGLISLQYFIRVLGFFAPIKYNILQSPRKIIAVVTDLNARAGNPETSTLESDLEERLTTLYANASSMNECENERRRELLHYVVRWSIVALFFLFANSVPFFYTKLTVQTPAQAVEIVKPVKVEYERPTTDK